MRYFCLVFLITFALSAPAKQTTLKDRGAAWKSLPLQHQGRVKPFDTFSREILRSVYGQDNYKGKSAVNVILSWILIPDHWEDLPFILIESARLKKALSLKAPLKRFAPKDFRSNKKFGEELIELQSLRQNKEPLNAYFKELEKLEKRLILYESVKTGWLLKLKPDHSKKEWISLRNLKGESEKLFREALLAYAHLISKDIQGGAAKKASAGTLKEADKLNQLLLEFQRSAFQGEPKKWFSQKKIDTEVFYNSWPPFRLAGILYGLFLLFFSLLFLLSKQRHTKWLLPVLALAFVSHTLGLLLRSYIMSRPPVSNMYETLVWVPYIAVIIGCVFYFKQRTAPFLASLITAFFCLFLVDRAPEILDGSLQPLEAVLRSNFWLSTHVLIITMSYAFFFVAFVLADMALLYFLFQKKRGDDFIKRIGHPLYRLLQWGVGGLALGTVLGAVWADYSWGRFWGWDPKESWALITLLGYVALLHARLAGWIKAFGLAVGSLCLFFLVIMAWYGVNFILGKGLHSYGFGTGGLEYVTGFFLLHLILAICALLKKRDMI